MNLLLGLWMSKSDTEKLFMDIVENHSIVAVAKRLGRNKSSVHREIKQYEADFGAPLLYKKGIKLFPTEIGRQLYESIKQFCKEKQKIQSQITATTLAEPRVLKIGATQSIISTWLPGALMGFMEENPHITVYLSKFNFEDNGDNDYDLIVGARLRKCNYINLPFVTHTLNLYASINYINQFGKPENIAALKDHQLLAYKIGSTLPYEDINFHLTQVPGLTPRFFIDSGLGMVQAVDSGLGIGPISIDEGYYLCKSRVVPILPGLISSKIHILVNVPRSKFDEHAVNSLIGYLNYIRNNMFM
jgi:Transcriptional regulator